MIELSYPGDLTDPDELAVQLSTTGLSPEACESKARLFARTTAALAVTGNTAPPMAFFVPGRIEVLGKHTDYAGGRTLVAAAEHGFCIVAQPRDDRRMVVIDARSGETIRFGIDPGLTPPTDSWAQYPMTVAARVARNLPGACRGADVAMVSDLPAAAGLASSAALTVGMFLVLSETNQLPSRDEYWHNIGGKIDLAGYLGAIQSGQSFGTFEGDADAGVFGGDEDHTAILCAEANEIGQYAYCPVEFERAVRVPPGHVFAIGATGVVVEATDAARARRNAPRRLADLLARLWQRKTGRDDAHLADALSSAADAADQLKHMLETDDVEADDIDPADRVAMIARVEHFMLESGEILPEAADALAGNDLRAFGRLVDRSQHLTERLLGDQTPETIFLAASARRLGAEAASSFGPGFGGSVWALLEAPRADDFLTAWADEYRIEFAQHSERSKFFLTGAGPAAFRVC